MKSDAGPPSRPTSDDQLKSYVELELARSRIAERQDLSVVFQGRVAPLVPLATSLWWVIECSRWDATTTLISQQYVLEARLAEHQFVVWFGGLGGFVGETARDVMRPAVHVPFPWALDAWAEESPSSLVRDNLRSLREISPSSVGASFRGIRPLHRTAAPEDYQLAAVLNWMLANDASERETFDAMVYPMSGLRY